MRNLSLSLLALLFSSHAFADMAKFQAGVTYEKCTEDQVKLERICELNPIRWETVMIDLESGYGFHEQRISDGETNMEFSVNFSIVKDQSGDFYDLHVAIRSKGDEERWSFNKIRLKHFTDLNQIVFHGQPVKVGEFEYEPSLWLQNTLN